MRPFSQEELEFIFGEDEKRSIDKMDVTLDLHLKMRNVIQLIYETDALQQWAHENGDEETSIADKLKDVYNTMKLID